MTRFAVTSGTCVAVANQPVTWEPVSFPSVDELARHVLDANM
jgi:hypothetical protein